MAIKGNVRAGASERKVPTAIGIGGAKSLTGGKA
jgi:hypothetical protein